MSEILEEVAPSVPSELTNLFFGTWQDIRNTKFPAADQICLPVSSTTRVNSACSLFFILQLFLKQVFTV